MRNRFTRRACNVLLAAKRAAVLRMQQQVDTEHILCGLLSDNSCRAAIVLYNLGIPPAKIALALDKRISCQACPRGNGPLFRTVAAYLVVQSAIDEARGLSNPHVGTEHLLLGLLRNEEGVARLVLEENGLTTDSVRAEILRAFPRGRNAATITPGTKVCAFRDAERQFHLSVYRLAVDYYKPRIEMRAGISLGDINVWGFEKLPEHEMADIGRQKSFWLPGAIWRFLYRKRLRRCAKQLATLATNAGRKYTACYYRRGIYVSFDCGVQHEEEVAAAVVHELSHALWETISDVPLDAIPSCNTRLLPNERKNLKLLVEGFAVYCERVWFLDIYPAYVRESVQKRKLDSVYERGFCQVKRLVKQHGPEILLEIPKRWRELDFA